MTKLQMPRRKDNQCNLKQKWCTNEPHATHIHKTQDSLDYYFPYNILWTSLCELHLNEIFQLGVPKLPNYECCHFGVHNILVSIPIGKF